MKYIVNPGVNYPKNLAEADVICKYLNKVGEMVNAAGMKFGYHNHSHEFGRVEGKVWYDYMVEHTDADKVFFEMDVYWAVRGQVSPVEYFNKYPGRFTLLHIKDHKEFGESGMVGFDAIFNNADKAGLKHLVVELEGSNRPNILDGMKVCADYLKAAKFVKPTYAK
jgi:sugar phosphate isomerase/epimerase